MKVLSLLQPWATLVVLGLKKIETRSWNTTFRGPLLIHASIGKYYGKAPHRFSCRELCYREPFSKYITGAAYDELPFGAIIGQVSLEETFQFGSDRSIQYVQSLTKAAALQEIAFGDWEEGRWGWRLEGHMQFKQPIPAKGALNLWDYELPDSVQQLYNTHP